MEMEFGSRTEIGAAAVAPGEIAAGGERGAKTRASPPPAKRPDGLRHSAFSDGEFRGFEIGRQRLVLAPHHHAQYDFLNVTVDDDVSAIRRRWLLDPQDRSRQHESKHREAVTE